MSKQNILISFIFILFFLIGIGQAQSNMKIDDPDAKYTGLSLLQAKSGSGLGGFFEYSLNSSFRLRAECGLLLIRGENDYPITYYDPYYQQYMMYEQPDKKRLSLLPIYFGAKKMLFTDQLANNFRPYLSVVAGPIIAFDPPNIRDFKDRMKNIEMAYTFGGKFGTGVDFLYGPGTIISLFCGYDISHFSRKIDKSPYYFENDQGDMVPLDAGKKNYSGISVSIGFGKKF